MLTCSTQRVEVDDSHICGQEESSRCSVAAAQPLPSSSESRALADQAVENYEAFSKELRKSSSYRKLSAEYAKELDSANGDALREVLCRHLDNANAALGRFEGRGRARRLCQRVVRFLSAFSAYIDAYGGIVEVMRAIGGEYGETAYKILSMLLIVRGERRLVRL